MKGDLSQIINLERYPVTNLASKASERMLTGCHNQIEENGLCLLPNFVTDKFLNEMIDEVKTLANQTYRTEHWRSPFGRDTLKSKINPLKTRASMDSISYDLLGAESKMRQLYESEYFTEFLRKVLKTELLFKCIDPMISCIIAICREGDELGWHYDPNDGVVTLLLQKSLDGGNFEFAPNIRNSEKEITEEELSVIRNEGENTISISQSAGTLSIFNGFKALHRVTPVGPKQERVVVILSYANTPDYIFSDKIRQSFFGRSN